MYVCLCRAVNSPTVEAAIRAGAVSIDPRVLVPRVIREDSRWLQAASEQAASDEAGKGDGRP